MAKEHKTHHTPVSAEGQKGGDPILASDTATDDPVLEVEGTEIAEEAVDDGAVDLNEIGADLHIPSAPVVQDDSRAPVQIRALVTKDSAMTVAGFNWQQEVGGFENGKHYVVPRYVANHLIECGVAILIA